LNKDYFSKQSAEYAKYRPLYPKELYEYLNNICVEHKRAWDCATGNGQAARGLIPYFNEIIATDISESQLKNAFQDPKIKYGVRNCEDSNLESRSVDLIVVATAIHWINTDKFYKEVYRILNPNGIIAVWTYMHSNITPQIDSLLIHFEKEILKTYWAAEIKLAWDFDKLIYFPFRRLEAPEFYMETNWHLNDLKNYLFTWSAVQNYIMINKSNPIDLIATRLSEYWENGKVRKKICWKLRMNAGGLLN
jgi:ubiquinone/menaquinone biosynthesis C-methylase UbiE